MKKFWIGLLCGLTLPALLGYLFLISGKMPVAVKDSELPLEHWMAKKALRAAYRNEADLEAPFPLNEAHLVSGARLYRNHCGGCHSISDHENLMAKSMFPPAPQFFRPKDEVEHDPIGKIHWKIKNGIRLTGMPGYSDILNESEIWELSLFLKNTSKLPEPAKKALAGE